MSSIRASIDKIRQLIALPSVSSVIPELDQSNLSVINLLADWLSNSNFKVEILPVDQNQQKFNLIATKGCGAGGLILSGHTDTVPTNEKNWYTNPFELTQKGARLYGLGTSDMKSFLALAIEASKEFSANQLKQPLIILATADEESTMAGARALLNAGKPAARSALIGEPTGNRPVRLHKGVMMDRIIVTGKSGHSSNPALGKNAIEGMHTVLAELMALRQELQLKNQNSLFQVPVPTLNLGHIHGGDSANRICGECALDIDLRPLPGMDISELRYFIEKRLQSSLQDTEFELNLKPLFQGIPALETDANCKIVSTAESLSGQTAESVAFATEGPYLQQLGMDVLIMGPGRIDQAHQANEFIEISELKPTLEFLQQLIHQHCVVGL